MGRVTVKVHPRAKRTAITGRLGEAYKLDLKAPPVEGKANEECVRFFAELTGVARSQIRILSGLANRNKVVDVEGIEQEKLEQLLARYTRS